MNNTNPFKLLILALFSAGGAHAACGAVSAMPPNPHTSGPDLTLAPKTRSAGVVPASSCGEITVEFVTEIGHLGYSAHITAVVEDLDGDGVVRADAGYYNHYEGPTEVRDLTISFFADGLELAAYECVNAFLISYPFLYFEWAIGDLELTAWDLGADPGIFTIGGVPVTATPGAFFWDQTANVIGSFGMPNERIQIDDLIEHDTMEILSRWGTPLFDIEAGNAVYLVEGLAGFSEARYHRVDISNPSEPITLCNSTPAGVKEGVKSVEFTADGTQLYIHTKDLSPGGPFSDDDSVSFHDLSGPGCPSGDQTVGGLWRDSSVLVASGDNFICISQFDLDGPIPVPLFYCFVLDPTGFSPVLHPDGLARHMKVSGPALIADFNEVLTVVDVTNPLSPVVHPSFGGPIDLFDTSIIDGFGYIFAVRDFDPGDGSVSGRDEIVVYRLVDSFNPVEVGTYELPLEAIDIHAGTSDLLVTLEDSTVLVLDVGIPAVPLEIQRVDIGEPVTKAKFMDDRHIAIAAESDLVTVRVRPEASIHRTDGDAVQVAATTEFSFVLTEEGAVFGNAWDGSVSIMPNGHPPASSIATTAFDSFGDTLAVQTTHELYFYSFNGSTFALKDALFYPQASVVASNGLAMVAIRDAGDGTSVLSTLNLSDLNNVVILGQTSFAGDILDVAYYENRVYVSQPGGYITVVDVSSPDTPVVLGDVQAGADMHDIEAMGGWLAAIDSSPVGSAEPSRLYLFDTSAGGLPLYTRSQQAPLPIGSLSRVETNNFGELLAAGSIRAVDFYDLSVPCEPKIIASFDGSRGAVDDPILGMATFEDRLVAAVGPRGYSISDLSQLVYCPVDTDGNGTCDPFEPVQNLTQGTGFGEIQGAIDQAAPDDIIEIGAGVFAANGVTIPFGMDLTIQGVGANETILDGSIIPMDVPLFDFRHTGQTSATVIRDLTIRNGSYSHFEGGGGARIYDASPTFINVAFIGNSGPGEPSGLAHALVQGSLSHVVFDRCVFMGGHGAFGAINASVAGTLTMRQCLIAENQTFLAVRLDSTGNSITNCTVAADDTVQGRAFLSVGGSADIVNTVILGSVVDGGGATYSLSRCLTPSGAPGDNITGSPTFVDRPGGDYRLDAGSLGIDAADGDAMGIGATDLAGLPRLYDDSDTIDSGIGAVTFLDVGAYEYQGPQVVCPADLDGNGTLNFDDIDAFVAGFLGGDLTADLDGNGTLNFDDIDLFVGSFLAGCG